MSDKIEIYVRPGSEHKMMNIYVPEAMKERLLDGISKGCFELSTNSINFEISVQAKWITNPEQRRQAELAGDGSSHVRVPLKAINVHFRDE